MSLQDKAFICGILGLSCALLTVIFGISCFILQEMADAESKKAFDARMHEIFKEH